MRTYGFEFAILPLIGFPYFFLFEGFSLPASLANNAVLTAVCAIGAYYVSRRLAKSIGAKNQIDRLAPAWPAFMSLWLAYIAGLQLIMCVTHLSYYRKGDFAKDLFDKH
eukprot:GILI01035718.1.p1 GENE.GILI01035718.1~~GILI01035718.1.p1  ORF type:complete len:109 (-),score=8.60 GILI01035718.1:55-381(-)